MSSWIIGAAAASAAVALTLVLTCAVGPRGSEPPRGGELLVAAHPAKARVLIDGVERCRYLGGLAQGKELIVTVRSSGHAQWQQRLVLEQSQPALFLRPALRAQPR